MRQSHVHQQGHSVKPPGFRTPPKDEVFRVDTVVQQLMTHEWRGVRSISSGHNRNCYKTYETPRAPKSRLENK